MNESEIPRDPANYHPTTHAKQQRRWRDIDWDLVAETIAQGNIYPSHKDNCKLFIRDYDWTEYPVAVVANYETGKIVTVEWRHK